MGGAVRRGTKPGLTTATPGQGRVSGGKPYTSGPAYQVAPRPGTAPCQAGRAVPSRMAWAPGAHWARARPVWKPAAGRRTGAAGGTDPDHPAPGARGDGLDSRAARGRALGGPQEPKTRLSPSRRKRKPVSTPVWADVALLLKRGRPTTQRRCSAGGRQGSGTRRLGAWYSCLSLPCRPPPTSSPPLFFLFSLLAFSFLPRFGS